MASRPKPTDELPASDSPTTEGVELLNAADGSHLGDNEALMMSTELRFGRERPMVRGGTRHRATMAGAAIGITLVVALSAFALPIAEARLLTQVVALTVILWGLDVQLGLGGQLSLGHGAFVGVGAYAAAIALGALGWPFPVAIALAAGCGFLAGVIVGLPSLRIGGQYLAMVTLGLAVAFPFLVKRFPSVTGGANGPKVDYQFVPPAFLGLEAKNYHIWSHILICLFALGTFLVVRAVVGGSAGRIIRAVADDATAATAYGLNVGVVRVATVALSASIGAIGGALLTFATPGAISAESFDLAFSLSIYAAAVFGGIGTLFGSLLGSLLLVFAPWVSSELGLTIQPELIAGVVLLVFTLWSKNRGVAHLVLPWLADRFPVLEPEQVADEDNEDRASLD